MPELIHKKIRLLKSEKEALDNYKSAHGTSFVFLVENAVSILLYHIVDGYISDLKQQKLEKKIRELRTNVKEQKVAHTERLQISLTPKTNDALMAFCSENKYNVSDVVRAAIQSYIEGEIQ
mgnify:CR=1 FL=1